MSKYISHLMSGNTLTVIFAGEDPISIPREDPCYDKVLELIRNGRYDEVFDATQSSYDEEFDGFRVRGNQVLIDGEIIPEALSERIIQLVQYELDVKPLINFWHNVKQNKREDSRKDLYGFLEANHYPITEDGCFVGYKSVRSDFLDHHSRSMDNSPGKTVEMPREQVNPDRNVTCSTGLHVAAYPYAAHFCGGETIVEVKVHPKDVVTVPTDYNAQKMRCCRYEVVRVNRKPLREQVYTGRAPRKAATATAPASGIRRLPKEMRTVYPDGRGAISISTEIFERLGWKAGDEVYAYITNPRSRSFRVSKTEPGEPVMFKKLFKIGKLSTRIFPQIMKACQIYGEDYQLSFNKGELVVKP